jgi:hypothetical protein
MGGTIHVTVRLPVETVTMVDVEAARLGRSRSWVIAWILSDVELYSSKENLDGHRPAASGGRGDISGVSTGIYDVASRDSESKVGGGKVVKRSERSPAAYGCPECGSLSGHQKFCSKR